MGSEKEIWVWKIKGSVQNSGINYRDCTVDGHHSQVINE